MPALAAVLAVALLSHAAGAPMPASAAAGTWTGAYYGNATLAGAPVLTRDDGPTIGFFYDGATAPAPGVPPQQFSVRWTRTDTYAAATYRFSITADDGMRVYVDGAKILDAWLPQPATSYYVDDALSAGPHTVTVEYYNGVNGGQANVSIQDITTVTPATGTWIGSYYANPSLSGIPVISRDDGPVFNFFFDGVAAPVPGVPPQQFSVRWVQTNSFVGGTYTFTITADDGMRVYVDGTKIVDAWIPQPPTTYSANYNLTSGVHTITVEY
ncbi:MAG: PA14 domain-containing protein, partial [Dehalococcoidia bacterium]